MNSASVQKICIPIRESNVASLEVAIASARSRAGFLELRLDYLDPSTLTVSNLNRWAALAEVPVIATFRRKANGGEYPGDEAEQLRVADAAIQAKVGYVDLEIETIENSLRGNLSSLKCRGTRIIASYHHFETTPPELQTVFERLQNTRPDVVKIATLARSFSDNYRLLELITLGEKDRMPVIAVAMGELGIYSRILAPSLGAVLTYGSLEEGLETAPGQVTAKDLHQIYRIHEIDPQTKLLGVIGFPIGHSLSPYIHNRGFQEAGLNFRYLPFPVRNLDDFASHLDRFDGFSVTIPHKVAILKYAGCLDDTVRITGAGNTLVKEGTYFRAYNTDVDGVRAALRVPLDRGVEKVVLLGAGGAARAVAVVLREAGCKVTVLGRNLSKAKAFAEEFGFAWDSLAQSPEYGGDLLINATSVGMSPQCEEMPVDADSLDYRYVFDLVYNPLETRLLRECQGKAKIISGLDMFIAQAARQFELWTGLSAPQELMRNVALERLRRPVKIEQ
ncbi:MAG TPA: shikimate dehydrogenase [Terriglobia bacterium]|nr:shikimate dehydrogenase [Terriglobia bacterium]